MKKKVDGCYFQAFSLLIFLSFLGTAMGCHKSDMHSLSNLDSLLKPKPLSVSLKHALPAILRESSGLCFTDGNLWTFGDSGNPNEIFKIDSSSGAIIQTVVIDNFTNNDWEDISADSSFIYLGDFGNNNGDRKDLRIIRISKNDLVDTARVINVSGEAINFSYSDQTDFSSSSNTNFDCESLISIGKFLYVFTKDGVDLQTRCYKIPNIPGDYSVSPISSFDTKGKITAAAYNPETGEIALLGYMNKKVESFIWFLDGYQGDDFFSANTVKITFGNSTAWQTEGLDYISANRLFMSCESSGDKGASLYVVRKE